MKARLVPITLTPAFSRPIMSNSFSRIIIIPNTASSTGILSAICRLSISSSITVPIALTSCCTAKKDCRRKLKHNENDPYYRRRWLHRQQFCPLPLPHLSRLLLAGPGCIDLSWQYSEFTGRCTCHCPLCILYWRAAQRRPDPSHRFPP